MAYTPPDKPEEVVNNYSMLQWFDPQAEQNAKTPDWQRQWNAANLGSDASGRQQDAGLWLPDGTQAPTDKDGQWVMGGNGRLVFIPNQPTAAPMQPVQEQASVAPPPAPTDGKTIFNDWDFYQNQARGENLAANDSPFVSNPQKLIGLDADQQMQRFYPGAWQEGGVQKVIGPNGQNIAPELQSNGLFAAFQDAGVDTSKAADWPSMIDALMDKGLLADNQYKFLSDLTKPKKLDQSFAGQPMSGMMK